MKTVMGGALLVVTLMCGAAGNSWASDQSFFEACARKGQGEKCHICGAVNFGFPSSCSALLDIAVQPSETQPCVAGTCVGFGMRQTTMQNQIKYVDSHNSIWVTGWGGGFGLYDPLHGNGPIRYYKVTSILANASVAMLVTRKNTGNLVYITPTTQDVPSSYNRLTHVGLFSNHRRWTWEGRYRPYAAREDVHGRTVLKNSAGSVLEPRPTFLLGNIYAEVGGYSNNMITLNIVYNTP